MPVVSFQMPDGQIAHFQVPDGMALDEARSIIQGRFSKSSGGLTAPTAPTRGTPISMGTQPTAGAPIVPLGFPALPGLPGLPGLPRSDLSEFYRYASKPDEPAPYAQESRPKESLMEIMNRLRVPNPNASAMPSKNMLVSRRFDQGFALKDQSSQRSMKSGFNALADMLDPSLYRRAPDVDESW